MMLLDFSREFKIPQIDDLLWKKEIIEFLKEWYSEKDFITSKTSGSTGVPKEIKIPKIAMKMSAQMTGDFFGLQKGHISLLCMPVNFIAGKMMIVRAAELKLKLYCTEPKSKIQIEIPEKLDFVPMTPMQVKNSIGFLNNVKKLLIGGAPLSDELRKELLKIKTECYESYGMTETITHIALKKISDENFKTLNQIKIKTDDRGCLVIKTPYFEEEIFTNDIVNIVDEREFKWLGRIDNVINSGGIKLFPEQIESKLKPHIKEEFIISSLPDEALGRKLILIIESTSPVSIQFSELNLTKFEIPKEIYCLENFPRTESGKIKRNEILDLI